MLRPETHIIIGVGANLGWLDQGGQNTSQSFKSLDWFWGEELMTQFV